MLNKTLLRGSDEQPYEIHVVGDKRNAYAVANSERLSLMTVVYEDKTPFAGFYLERDAKQFVAFQELLAEHDVLCELVGLYETRSALTINSNAWNEMTYKITTLRGRLQV